MCTVPLPPGVYPIAVDKYINVKTYSGNTKRTRKKDDAAKMMNTIKIIIKMVPSGETS